MSDDGQEPIGSLFILNATSRHEAQAFVDGDPFTQAGLFTDVRIKRMSKDLWYPEAAQGA